LDETFKERLKLEKTEFDNLKPSDTLKEYEPQLYQLIGNGGDGMLIVDD